MHLFGLQGEDWLAEVTVLDDRDARKQETLRQKLLDLLHGLARENYEQFPQAAHPHYHLFLRWVCAQLSKPVIQRLLSFARPPAPSPAMRGALPQPPPPKEHYLLVFLVFTEVMPLRILGKSLKPERYWETLKAFDPGTEEKRILPYMDALRRSS